jgi:hypothetical protein
MTLHEAKNTVAQKYGFTDWWSLDFNKTNISQEALRDEAAEVYAKQIRNNIDKAELTEMIAKVHDDMEGRYNLTGEDIYTIHYLLCKLQ